MTINKATLIGLEISMDYISICFLTQTNAVILMALVRLSKTKKKEIKIVRKMI